LIERGLLALGCSEVLESAHARFGDVLPVTRPDHRLHICNPLDLFGKPRRTVKADSRTPVVDHQGYIRRQVERVEEGIEIVDIVLKSLTTMA
jgi:hypothetical protein